MLITATKNVSWRKWGNITSVKLEYTIDNVIYHSLNWDGTVEGAEVVVATPGTGPYPETYSYDWVIPDNPSTTVKVKVSNYVNSDVYSDSGEVPFLIIRPGFGWLTPDPEASLNALTATDPYVFTWDTFGTVDNVKILYSDTSGATWKDMFNDGAAVDPATEGTVISNQGVNKGTKTLLNIPDDINSSVYLMILDAINIAAEKTLKNCQIRGELTLQKPDSSSIWLAGGTGRIEWKTKGTLATIKIEYSKDGGESFTDPDGGMIAPMQLAANPEGGNTFYLDWLVDGDAISPICAVRITDNLNDQVTDQFGNFPIKASFTVVSPTNTDTWIIDSTKTISWNTIGAVDKVDLYYFRESTGQWVKINNDEEITNNSVGLTTYPWQVADSVSDIAKIKVVDVSDDTALRESSEFKIRGSLTLIYPNDAGEEAIVGRTCSIQWEPHGSIGNVFVEYFLDPVWVPVPDPLDGDNIIANSGSVAWIVPDVLINGSSIENALIKVRSIDWPDTDPGLSENAFRIIAGFTLLKPNGGEPVFAGTPYTIEWTCTSEYISDVTIDYSLDGGNDDYLYNILATTANDASEIWDVPNDILITDKARIRISDAGDAAAHDESNNNFFLRAKLELKQPDGEETFVIGVPNAVKWTCLGDIPQVNLEYTTTGDWADKRFIATVTNNGEFSWTILDDFNFSDECLLRVSDPNDYLAQSDSEAAFRIVPGFVMTYPVGTEDFKMNTNETITWTCTAPSQLSTVTIWYSVNGGGSWGVLMQTDNDGEELWESIGNGAGDIGVDKVTTKAQLRVGDPIDDTISAKSEDFDISANFEIISPNGGGMYTVGDDVPISWTCNGTVSEVDLYYSTGGVWNPIETDVANSDILNIGASVDGSYNWSANDAISKTVRVRVADSVSDHPYADDDSDADFRIKGNIWMKAPVLNDSWDIGQDYDVKWGWIGTIPEVKITYSINGLAGPFNPVLETYGTADDGIIANAVGSGGAASEAAFSWTIPDEAAADTVIRIVDSRGSETDVTDDTGSFHIVGYIIAKEPVSTDVLEVDKTFDIKWEWGGTMPEVKITYSTNGAGGTFDPIKENYDIADDGIVANRAGGGGPGSEATYTWSVPDAISDNCVVKIADPDDATVDDDTDEFKIVGAFIMTSPNGTECWITRELHNITWITVGTIANVTLLYSKDDFGSDSNVIVASVANTDSYPWTVADDRSATVKVRVHDATDVDVYDDSDANFIIDYYTLNWVIRDLLTNVELSGLTVEAVSDKEDEWKTLTMPDNPAAPLGSPIAVELPYGFWTAIWSKTEFGDKQINFMCDEDKTLDTIYMETSAIHIWRAYSEFTYDAASDDLKITSWLERDGSVVSGAQTIDVNIYNDSGILIKTLNSSTPNSVGFFNLEWTSCDLASSVLYSTLTVIKNASGAEFKTPSSFSITETKQMKSTEDAVVEMRDSTLPAFQVAVQTTIDEGVAEQKAMIEDKMDEQINIIDTKTTEMKTSVDETLSSFEERTDEAITELKAGADQATKAGEELETIAKRQSGELIIPNSVLVGGNVEIRYRNTTGLLPLMDIISYDGVILYGAQPLYESATTPGLYGYDLFVDGNTFMPGKAFTVIVTESTTGNLQAGSIMVESTSLTSIEGLASSIPQIKSMTDAALEAIKGVEGTLATGGDVGIALNALQESIDDFPDFMDHQGPNEELINTLNDVSSRLSELAGGEGFDISGMIEDALEESPTIKELKKKTENIKSIVKFLQALFEHKFGGVEEEPVVSTSLSSGSLVVNVVAANPSSTKPQTTRVKVFLPKEVTPNDVIDLGGLDIEFDATKSIYYVFRDEIELAPKEIRVYKVEIEDIWFVSQTSIDIMKMRATKLAEALEGSEYEKDTNKIVDDIYNGLDEIVRVQNDIGLSREQHIGAYRVNIKKMEEYKSSLTDVEKLMIKRPDQIGAMTKAMTWKIILLVIGFIGLLAAVFFFTWYRKAGLTKEAIEQAKQFSFPEEEEAEEEETKK